MCDGEDIAKIIQERLALSLESTNMPDRDEDTR
jgi:hypothetical protein